MPITIEFFFHGNGLINFPLFLMGKIRLVYVLFGISPRIWNELRTYTEVPLYMLWQCVVVRRENGTRIRSHGQCFLSGGYLPRSTRLLVLPYHVPFHSTAGLLGSRRHVSECTDQFPSSNILCFNHIICNVFRKQS
jgi:hypothetical protein